MKSKNEVTKIGTWQGACGVTSQKPVEFLHFSNKVDNNKLTLNNANDLHRHAPEILQDKILKSVLVQHILIYLRASGSIIFHDMIFKSSQDHTT